MSSSQSKAVKALVLILRIALGLVFIYAAYTKLGDSWRLFAPELHPPRCSPMWAVQLLARTLPWFELLVGVLQLGAAGCASPRLQLRPCCWCFSA